MEIIVVILAFIFGSESEMRKTCVNISNAVSGENYIDFQARIAMLEDEEREIAYCADSVVSTMHWRGMTWNDAVSYHISDIQERAKGSAWAGDEEKLCSMYQSLYI